MNRSLLAGSVVVLVATSAALISSCSDPETTPPPGTSSSSSGSGPGGAGGSSGSAGGSAGMGGMGGAGGGSSSSSSATSSSGTSSSGGGSGGGGGASMFCVPGETKSCYSADPATMGVGPCKAGVQTCNANGSAFGACVGEVLPSTEVCANAIDENCDGTVDNVVDQDADGWTTCDGDCCDVAAGDCDEPAKVNPGAFEYLGNLVDDDCNPATPDDMVPPPCSTQALATPTSSQELIQAMDLCNFTVENPPLPQKVWGVISSQLLLADGSSNVPPKDVQVGVLNNFGSNVLPQKDGTMAAISSGTARDETDVSYVHPQNGSMAGQVGNYNANTESNAPADWLMKNGGVLPSPANCPACNDPAICTKAYDSVNLKIRMRVPTNALSFSYKFKFYTAEFPEFVCQAYNDFFLTMLTSGFQTCPGAMPDDPCVPADKNIAKDFFGNLVSVNNAFLEVCFPPPGSPAGTCPGGTLDLIGTGFGGWNGNLKDGGGTVWLTNDAPVVPGETIELEFIMFDAGDHNVDSLVLLDKFKWNIKPSQAGVHK